MQPIAQAYYQSAYQGRVLVSLMPYRTTDRHLGRIWRYRWVDDRGSPLPYVPARRANYLVSMALLNPLFDSVACMVGCGEHFPPLVD